MGAVRRPRGRLPRRVYWVRRSALLTVVALVALGVVVGVARLTGGTGSDAAASGQGIEQATRANAETGPGPTYGPLQAVPLRGRERSQGATPVDPTGPCSPRDVRAVPVLDAPEAGSRVRIGVALTGTQAACTFEVSPASLVVKVVDAKGRDFWASQQCEDVVPTEDVVVRSGEPTVVQVRWNARASARGCGDYDRWALPGFYDVLASVQGSSPEQVRFELLPPSVEYRTETPSPTAKPSPGAPASSPAASPAA